MNHETFLEEVVELTNNIPLSRRDNWEEYFMAQAFSASTRATCGSRRVGAVIIDSLEPGKRHILSTGYNGTPEGSEHCIDGGCPRFAAKEAGLLVSGEYTDEYPCYAFHAESNAISQMTRLGQSTEGCILFCTAHPCRSCAEKILQAGIKKVYYYNGYPDEQSKHYLSKFGVETTCLKKEH